MKRKLAIAALSLGILGGIFQTHSADAVISTLSKSQNPAQVQRFTLFKGKVLLNGKNMIFPDAKPVFDENNHILVPIRFISEQVGAKVTSVDKGQVGITHQGTSIRLIIGDNRAFVDDKEIVLDTKTMVKDGRTYVPLRFVSEALGTKVEWDGIRQYVILGDKKFLTPEELGLKAQSVDRYLYLFQDDENHYFLKNYNGEKLKGFYVISKEDLPIKMNEKFILHDVWNNRDSAGIYIYPTKPALLYLTRTHSPRPRMNIDEKTQMLNDGTKKFYFPILGKQDRSTPDDTTWKDFSLEDTEYLGINLKHNGYGILVKDPFK
jgi:hypothetical protein